MARSPSTSWIATSTTLSPQPARTRPTAARAPGWSGSSIRSRANASVVAAGWLGGAASSVMRPRCRANVSAALRRRNGCVASRRSRDSAPADELHLPPPRVVVVGVRPLTDGADLTARQDHQPADVRVVGPDVLASHLAVADAQPGDRRALRMLESFAAGDDVVVLVANHHVDALRKGVRQHHVGRCGDA